MYHQFNLSDSKFLTQLYIIVPSKVWTFFYFEEAEHENRVARRRPFIEKLSAVDLQIQGLAINKKNRQRNLSEFWSVETQAIMKQKSELWRARQNWCALALLGPKKGCALARTRDFGFFALALALPLALISGLENRRTCQHYLKWIKIKMNNSCRNMI